MLYTKIYTIYKRFIYHLFIHINVLTRGGDEIHKLKREVRRVVGDVLIGMLTKVQEIVAGIFGKGAE